MYSEGSGREVVGEGLTNSSGRWSVVPYTISAAVAEISSLSAVQIPRRMRGSVSLQASGLGCALTLYTSYCACALRQSITRII